VKIVLGGCLLDGFRQCTRRQSTEGQMPLHARRPAADEVDLTNRQDTSPPPPGIVGKVVHFLRISSIQC
jgi:hypothetical protein